MTRCPHCGERRLVEVVLTYDHRQKWLCHVCAKTWVVKVPQ